MAKSLEIKAKFLELLRLIIISSPSLLLAACGDGADLSGLLSSSGGETGATGSLSDDYDLSASPELTRVNLSWNEDPDASSYELYRYQDSNCGAIPDDYSACANASYKSVSVASATDTGLSSNSIYFYRVRSVSGDQAGELSSQLEVMTLPDAPSSLSAAVANGRVTVSWAEQDGIDQYQLYRYSNQDCDTVASDISACLGDEFWNILGGDTSQQDSGLDGGDTYYYQVAAVNASGASSLSPQLSFVAPPESISSFGVVSSSGAIGGISLVWNDAAGASYYEIYRDSSTGCEGIPDDLELCPDAVQFIGDVSEYLDTSAQEGFVYYYSVRAVNDSGASALTTERAANMPLELFPPTLISVVPQGYSIDLSWSAVDKALSYQVYISTEPNCASFPSSPTACPGFVWLSPSTGSNITESTSASFGDLAEGTTYYLSTRAVTGDTVSALSVELNATTVPAAPASSSFAAIGGVNQVDLTWSASAGAATYSLYWHNDSSCLDSVVTVDDISANCSDSSVITDITGENYIHSNLNASTYYYYYLLANNAAGASAITTVVSALTAPAAVQNIASDSDTLAITLSWSSEQDNLERFELYRYQDSSCDLASASACADQSVWPQLSPNTFSQIDTTAAVGVVYYYQLAAVNNTTKSFSPRVTSALRLEPAEQINLTASENLLSVSWSAVTGAEHYVLYRYSGECPALPDSTNSCSNYQAQIVDANATAYTDSSVAAGEIYNYQVAARISGAEDSELSAIASGSPLLAAPELALTPVAGGVRIEFALISGAESYNIYRYPEAGCLLSEASASISCLDYQLLQVAAADIVNPSSSAFALYDDLNLVGGEDYYYRVSSVNSLGSSGLSPEVSSVAYLAQPAIVASVGGYGSSSVEWGAVPGAETYTIYQYLADGSNCYPQNTLASATCTAGFVEHSITAAADNSTAGYTYSQDFADLEGALDYGYVVLASNALVPDSVLSEPLILPVGLPAPEGLIATPDAGAVLLSWNPVVNASGYSVLRSSIANCLSLEGDNASCADYALLLAGLDLSLVDTELAGGTSYYYRVTALEDESATGAYSEEVSAIPSLSTPQNLQAVAGSGLVELDWDPVLGAEGYSIYRYTQQPCTQILDSGSDCGELHLESNNSAHSHISSSLVGEQTYYFRIAATHSGLSDSELSAAAEATPSVGVPTLEVSVVENSLTVSWGAVAGASAYNLHRSTSESCFLEVAPADYASSSSLCPDYQLWEGLSATSVSENNLSLDRAYFYTVQSVVAGTVFDIISNVASGLPLAQPQWLALAGGVEAVSITWDASSIGAESYSIYRSSIANCSEAFADWQQCPEGRIFSDQSSGVFTDQDSLAPGQTYYYRLQAVNYSGYAFNPTELSATTAPDTPADINVSFSELGVSVEWDASQSGVEQFDLYRYTVAGCTFIPDSYQQCGADSARWLAASSPLLDPVADLQPGTVYYYTLIASNAAGSSLSSEQQIITGSAAPDIGAIVGGYGSMEVSWGLVFGAESYSLYRYARADCSDAEVLELSADCSAYKFEDVSSPFTDPPSAAAELQLESSTYYYYRLSSSNSSATSALSTIGAGLTKPAAPELVVADGGDKSVYLEYTSANSNLNKYIFTRDTVSGCNLDVGAETCPFMVELDGDLDSNYTDTDLNPGTTYYYHAYTVNNSGRSLASNEFAATTIPNPPLNLAAVAASTTEIVVNWDRQTGAESYVLYRYTDPSCTTLQLEANISACGSEQYPAQLIADIPDDTASPEYIDSGLNSDAYYYYRIRAQNSGGISDFSEEASSLTSPSLPEGLVGVGGDEEVNLSWTPVANASYYYLYKYTNSGCATYAEDIASCSDGSQRQISPASLDDVLSSYLDSEVSNSTYYYYRLQAINASGASAISAELEVLTHPEHPQSISSSVSSSKISLTWSIENSVTDYELYRYTNSGCVSIFDDYLSCDDAARYQITNAATDTDFQTKTDDDKLRVGTIYYYRLVSHNASGARATDEFAIATAPATPENFAITPVLGLEPSLQLSWNADTTGVADFTIYRYQPAGCLLDDGDSSACAEGFPITFNGISAQSYTDDYLLATGTRYSYRVAATSSYSGQAQSALSDEQSASTFPAPPAITELAAGANSIAVGFEANQTGATSYTLHRYSGLPGCVSILGAETSCNDYKVYDNQTLSPILDTGLDSGTLYYYRIAADGAAGTGIYSDEYNSITLPAAPASIDLEVSLDGILVSWDESHQGADSFVLYRSRTLNCLVYSSDGSLCEDYLEIDSLTSGEYNDTSLAYGYEYYYQLRAVNASGTSELSSTYSAYTLPPAPSIDSIVGGANQVAISYSKAAISGITYYNLYRYSDSGCAYVPGNLYADCADGQRWSSSGGIDNTSETVTDDDLEDGTVYYYRLSAVNSSGEGPASAEYSAVTVPSAPTITAITGGNRKIEIEFTANLPTATSYLVYRYSIPGCYDDTTAAGCAANEWDSFSVSSSPLTDANLDYGSKYYYSIVAVNDSGISDYSNEEDAITIPAESTIVSVVGGDGNIEIYFDDTISGATSYHVYGYTGSNCLQKVSDFASKQDACAAVLLESAALSALESDLGDGTTRYYRVASVNESGSSELSSQVSGITLPPVAESAIFTGDDTSITLSWDDDQNGVSSYSVYQYSNSGCANFSAANQSDILNACASLSSSSSAESPVTFTGLNSGSTYYHLIQSSNAAGYKFTGELEATTVPAAPPAPSLIGGDKYVVIDFAASQVAGADYFQIYRSTTSACVRNSAQSTCADLAILPADPDQPLTADDFPYTDLGLLSGTTYYYHLSAHNELGASPYSSESVATTAPESSSDIELLPGRQAITINWTNSPGLEATYLYRYSNSGCSGVPTLIAACSDPNYVEFDSSITSYTDTGLDDGSTYFYVLQAVNASGSSLSSEYSALTHPAATSITQLTGGELNATIEFDDDLAGAVTNYQIYRHNGLDADCLVENSDYSLDSSACSGFVSLPTNLELPLTASPYTDTYGLIAGATYYYQIQSLNSSGGSALSPVAETITIPAAPLASSIAISSSLTDDDANVIEISWNNDILGNTNGSTLYRYTIEACQSIYGVNPDASQCSADDDYKVWDRLSATATAFTIEDADLQPATEYYYVIQVSNASGSAYSEEISAATYPDAPADPTLTGGNQQITVEWDNTMATVSTYTLHFNSDSSCVYDDPGCGDYLSREFAASAGNSHTFTNLLNGTRLSAGTTYYVTLVVENASGARASNTVSAITLPEAPAISSVTYVSSAAAFELSWSHPSDGDGVASYSLVRYEDPDCMDEEGDYSACDLDELYVYDAAISATATSFTDSAALEPATRYYYRLGANNVSGAAWSAASDQVTAPAALSPVVIPGSEDIDVSWSIAAGQEISSVQVYSTSQLGCPSMPNPACSDWWDSGELDPALGSITYSPSDSTKSYYLYLHLFNASGDALSAAVTSALLAAAPEFTTIAGGDQSIELHWQQSNNASYTLYFYDTSCAYPDAQPADCGNLEVSSHNQNFTTISSINGAPLAIGSEYFFRVSVTNLTSTSALSAESSAYTIAGVPENLTLTPGGNQIGLSWDPSPGVTEDYNVYRYASPCSPSSSANSDVASECSATVIEGKTSPYTDLSLIAGNIYYYRVTAVNSSGESAPSAEASAEVLLGAPENLSAVSSDTGIDLSWTKLSGTENHQIYRYTTANCMTSRADVDACPDYDTFTSGSDAEYTDTSASGGAVYYYRVAALRSGLEPGELSNEASVVANLLAPSINYAQADYGAITLDWNAVNGAASYTIYRYLTASCLTDSSLTCAQASLSATGTSYTDTNLDGLQTYYYRIAAASDDASVPDSPLSNEVNATTYLPAPINLSATPSELSVSLSWDAITSSALNSSDISYIVYRYTNSNSNCTAPHEPALNASCTDLLSNTSSANSYTDNSFSTGGSSYKYRVQAQHNGTTVEVGDISAEVAVQPIIATPRNLAIVRGSASLSLSWDPVTEADAYLVHRHNDANCASTTDSINSCLDYEVTTTSATSFAVSNLDPSLTYYFTVQASKTGADSLSGYSAVVSERPYLAEVTGFQAYASDALELTAQWDALDGANNYTVYFHQDPDCTYTGYSTQASQSSCSNISTGSTSGLSMEFANGIVEGQIYYFQVQASNTTSNNVSAFTSRLQVRAFKDAAVTSIFGYDQEINLSFDDAGGSYDLKVFRYTDLTCADTTLLSNVNNCALEPGDAHSFTFFSGASAEIADADKFINDTGLDEGKRYYYKVWSNQNQGEPGIYSAASSAMTMPPAPSALELHQSETYGNQISLTFAPPEGADNFYQLLRHNDADCANLSNANFNRSDYRDLTAVTNSSGQQCAGLTSLPTTDPSAFPASGTSIEYYLDDNLAPSTTYYYLYRSVNYSGANGYDVEPGTATGGTLSGTSVISNIVSWDTIPRDSEDGDLTIDPASGTSTSIPYAFSEIATATSYTVHRYLSSCSNADITTCPSHLTIDHLDTDIGTTHEDSGLAAGTEYSYILQAHNAAGSSDLSASRVEANILTLPADPALTAVIADLGNNEANRFTISWSDDSGVTYRNIYGSTDQACLQSVIDGGLGASATNIAGCDDHIYESFISNSNDFPITTHADDTALLSGTPYYFTITNHNNTGASLAFAGIDSNITVPAAPNTISLGPDYREIEVTWVPTLGSASNVLYRYNERTCNDPVDDIGDPTACGSDAAAYTFITEDFDFGFEPDSIKSFTFTDNNNATGLLDAEEYYYVVQALNVSGYRLTEDAFIESNTTAPAIPTGLDTVATDNSITLTWDRMATATQYQLLRSSDATCYTDSTGVTAYSTSCTEAATFTITSSSNNTETYTDTNLLYGTTYYYWIRSYSTSGGSPSTTTAEANTTAPPRADRVSLSGARNGTNRTNIEITWSAVEAATSYALYRSTDADCLSDSEGNLSTDADTNCADFTRSETSALTSTHSNLANDTIYYYYIAGINSSGEGRLSPLNSIRTAASAPSIDSVDNLSAVDQIQVSWYAASAYDSEYTIYLYSGSANCDPSSATCTNAESATVSSSSSSHTFSGLIAGTQYHAKIIATTEYTQEDNTKSILVGDISSNPLSQYTLPYDPAITSHSINTTNGAITLNLTPESGAGSDAITYTIRRTTSETADCSRIQAANSSSSCADLQTITSSSTTVTDNKSKAEGAIYYYYVWSSNPGGDGVLAAGNSSNSYEVVPLPSAISGITLTYNEDESTFDNWLITISSPEAVPDNNYWSLDYYPSKLNSPNVLTTDIDSASFIELGNSTHEANVSLAISASYYLQPHDMRLMAANSNGDTIELASLTSSISQPPEVYAFANTGSSSQKQVNHYFTFGTTATRDLYDDYALDPEFRIYITKNINCFNGVTTYDDLASNCSVGNSTSQLKNSPTDPNDLGAAYVYWKDATNPQAISSGDYFTSIEDFSNIAITDVEIFYYVYLIVKSYQLTLDGVNYSRQFTNSEYLFRIGGTLMTIHETSTNSIQPPSQSLVPIPPLLAQQLTATSSDHNSWDLSLLWSALSGISAYDIYEYSEPDCAYLLSEPSLCANFSLYSSNIPEFTRAFSAADSGNYFYYRLQVHDAAGNSSGLGEQIAAYLPQPLNDSGLAACVEESELISGSQDCSLGRDSSLEPAAKVGSGSAGFDFNSSIDASGALCVHDNVTGLSWSSWSPDPALAGAESNITTSSFASIATVASDACDHSDWRLPSLHELLSIADYNQSAAKIDTSVFREFNLSQPTYWSASGHIVDFSSGELSLESNASARHSVLLVRGERGWGFDFGAERFQLVEQLDDNNLSFYLVYDNQTQLHYSPCLAGQSYDPLAHSCIGVATALDYIDSLNAYDANSSWRQPNIKELVAILDPSNNLQPNPEFFPAYPTGSSIFSLTPQGQGADYITGRLFNPATQSTQSSIFDLLNSHLIYRN